MQGQKKVSISEIVPPKFIETPNGYDVTSNDDTIRISLRHVSVLDIGATGDFYATTMWIKEGNGWTKVSNTESYRCKEDFLKAINEVEDFTQAMRDYRASKE